MKTFSLFTSASSYEEGESMELPLKFEDIVDMYYDKMRPPKTHGSSIDIWNQSEFKENILKIYYINFSSRLVGKQRNIKVDKNSKFFIR